VQLTSELGVDPAESKTIVGYHLAAKYRWSSILQFGTIVGRATDHFKLIYPYELLNQPEPGTYVYTAKDADAYAETVLASVTSTVQAAQLVFAYSILDTLLQQFCEYSSEREVRGWMQVLDAEPTWRAMAQHFVTSRLIQDFLGKRTVPQRCEALLAVCSCRKTRRLIEDLDIGMVRDLQAFRNEIVHGATAPADVGNAAAYVEFTSQLCGFLYRVMRGKYDGDADMLEFKDWWLKASG